MNKNEGILSLYSELLSVSEAQKKVLAERRYEDVEKISQKRQDIIDKIKHLAREKGASQENEASKIHLIIKQIISIDEGIKSAIQKEMASISNRLNDIQKVKAFCKNIKSSQLKRHLNINA